MKRLIDSLDDFSWENYKTISDAVVKFDEANVENEMYSQASMYSYYHGLMSLAKKLTNDLEADNVRLASKLRSSYKNTHSKLTAKDLDDLVFADEEYNAALRVLNEASFKYELLKGLVRALEQKKDMLQQVSANKREETKLYK
jgi:hypothetical protein